MFSNSLGSPNGPRCRVLLDLKIRPFSHGDAGQMNFYLNYFKRQMSLPLRVSTISSFVSRDLVALPSAEELREFIQRDREPSTAACAKPTARNQNRDPVTLTFSAA